MRKTSKDPAKTNSKNNKDLLDGFSDFSAECARKNNGTKAQKVDKRNALPR